MSVQDRGSLERATVVSFSGEMDVHDPSLGVRLQRVIDDGARPLVVDLHDITFVDSSVIKSLVVAHRQLSDRGGWLRVLYSHHVVRRVIDMCGRSDVFRRFPTVEAARRHSASARHSHERSDHNGHSS